MHHEPNLVSLTPSDEQQERLLAAIRATAQLVETSLQRYPPAARAAILKQLAAGGALTVSFVLQAGAADIDCLLAGGHVFSFHLPKPAAERLH